MMTSLSTMPALYASGQLLENVGSLRDSTDILGDAESLRARMAEEGYLYLPGLLDRSQVLEARKEVTDRLAAGGFIDSAHASMQAVQSEKAIKGFMPDLLAAANQPLMRVLYSGAMIEFFDRFFGEPVRHYDFTWFRSIPPGKGTASHCDVVYMGRAEREQLYTVWTPIGDIDFEQGGLMILEGSHRHERLKSTYGQMDVDAYCENKPDARSWGKASAGLLKGNPNQIGRSLGGRWLTGEFCAGDVLIFSVFTVHASVDNRSNRIRLSSDSRYQPASKPADERWIGVNPVGHTDAGKRGKIC